MLNQRNSKSVRANGQEKLSHQLPSRAPHSKTIPWSQLADWQRDNEYIISGYRRVQNSWQGCFESVFGYLHNETINIHSHFFGALLFTVFLFVNQWKNISGYDTTTWIDTAVFSLFLSSAIFCLTASSMFHMAHCHSEKVSTRCHAFDYYGIIVLIVGSFYPAIYYGFFCDTTLQIIYLSLITVAGAGASFIVLSPEYSKPTHRGARTKVFIALGLSALLPNTHALLIHGYQELTHEMGFKWLLGSGALYILGALLYANRIPERFYPGKFDYFFASHQIFHVNVVLAALAHYVSILTALNHWHGRQGGMCPP
ncbi:HlyIII-domain-containing protein [Rickenella mellea]|uniref:HlyIII-domain-containing protein n=1 Tax=Rickenella mellea TaxID=50990 RepID=A0A4Y7Q742_9AGAM|nr:HlyIII-domain-containing protein [Rickenella mellea]